MNDGHVSWSPDYKSTPRPMMGAPLAPVTGSAAPDCCVYWTRSGNNLEVIAVLNREPGIGKAEMHFKFCPWCGRARQNDKLTDR